MDYPQLPRDFFFGTATAAFLIEGGWNEAVVRSALLTVQQAWQCDLFGQTAQELPADDQNLALTIEARRLATLKIVATL